MLKETTSSPVEKELKERSNEVPSDAILARRRRRRSFKVFKMSETLATKW